MSWYIKEDTDRDGNVVAFDVGHYTPVDRRGRSADLSFEALKSFRVEDCRFVDLSWKGKVRITFATAASLVSFLNGGATPPEDIRWNR